MLVSLTVLVGLTVYDTIRYDTKEEFNVDSKAEYSALSSIRSQKKKLKQTTPVPLTVYGHWSVFISQAQGRAPTGTMHVASLKSQREFVKFCKM